MGWLDWFKTLGSSAVLCETCLARAKAVHMIEAYVYRNGHILRPSSAVPSIAHWPVRPGVTTFCGRDVYGMGSSVLYRLSPESVLEDA